MKDKILIFIPAYNCSKQLPRVLDKFSKDIQGLFTEILIIENNSTDDTLKVAIKNLSKLKHIKKNIFQNNENYNLGGSHKVAFDYAIRKKFDYLVVLHGDDQGNIVDLIPHIKSGLFKQYDSLLGSRFAIGSKLIGYSYMRIILNYGFNFLCSILVRKWITDQGSGLNIYKISYLKNYFFSSFPNDLTFPNNMFFYGLLIKSKFKYFTMSWREDDQISNAKIWEQGARVLWLFINKKKIFKIAKKKINIKKSYPYKKIL